VTTGAPQRKPERGLRAARGRVRESAKPAHEDGLSTRSWDVRPAHLTQDLEPAVALECGWGRLLFGQTFATHDDLLAEVSREEPGRRDVCLYVREPHVFVSRAPQELFIDPSHTYRLWLHRHRPSHQPIPGLAVHDLRDEDDADAVNRIYTAAGMVTAPTEVLWANQRTPTFTYLVARDTETGQIVGTVTGRRPPPRVQRPRGRDEPVVARGRPPVGPPRDRAGARPLARGPLQGPRARLPRPVGRPRQRPGDRAVREARVRPRAGLLRQAQEPDQRAAVRREPGRGDRRPQPLRAPHRGRGAAAGHRRAGGRRRGGVDRAHPRRPHDPDPRVAVGADHRGGDGQVRRQAADPPAAGRRRHQRPRRPPGDRRPRGRRLPRPTSARRSSSPRGGSRGRASPSGSARNGS
jgi:hypothetical protein